MLCLTELARCFDFVPVCPEAGAGLGIPRPPIRLTGNPAAPRAVQIADASVDVTGKLQDFAAGCIPRLRDISGYIFIRNSPSCGLFNVNVFQNDDQSNPAPGRGIFAAALTAAMPLLPVEEEGRLQEPALRDNFITRVYAWHDWQVLQQSAVTVAAIVDFHSRYKYTLMAHSVQHYRVLGRLVGESAQHAPEAFAAHYIAGLMAGLQKLPTRGSHANVLMHLQGYLKKNIAPAEKQQLAVAIEQYRCGDEPLETPLNLLRTSFQRYPDPYITRQVYLQRRACP